MTYKNEELYNRLLGFLKQLASCGPHDASYVVEDVRRAIDTNTLSLSERLERVVKLCREMQASGKTIERFAAELVRESKAESYSIEISRRSEIHESLTIVVHANSKAEAETQAMEYADNSAREEWVREETNNDGAKIEGVTRIPK
jgi:hypothetical protein